MIWLIAKRELVTRGRSKGFLIVNAALFVGVIAVALSLSFLTGDDEARKVTIGLEGEGIALADFLAVGNDELDVTVTTPDDGLGQLEDGDIDVLFTGSELVWKDQPNVVIDPYIRSVVQQAALAERAEQVGLSQTDLSTLFAPVEIEEVRLDGGDEDFFVRLAAAGVAALSSFMLLQIWGSFLMTGVTEEKSSKVVEILLSHVRPVTLLTGKVIGLGILALAQMLIFVFGMVLGMLLVSDLDIPSGVWATVPLLLATFLLGFGFYATAFAAVGSMISRQEDAQTAQLPVVLPLLVGYFIAATSIGTPENLVVTIGSFVPFTSPVLLPFRTAMTDPPLWQIVVPLLILAASSVLMLQLAGKVYRYSLLRTGSKVSWAEAWRNRNVDAD